MSMADQNPTLQGPDLEQGVSFASLEENIPLLGHAQGEAVVVVRTAADVHAIGATCTHYSGPLAEGLVVGDTLRCPWHHACFDLRSGRAVGAPALGDVPCWKVDREGDLIKVLHKQQRIKPQVPTVSPSSVVIVGAGAAAVACAEELRKENYSGPITLLGAEEPGPVDRPNLSKDYLSGNAPEEWIALGSPEHYQDLGVTLRPTSPVASINPTAHTVTLTNGETIAYGALLYAPGAEPSRLPIDGADGPTVMTLRTLADSRAIIAKATHAKRAVIIGASFIGLEVAASLTQRGLEVHVVGPETVPLARVLGGSLGAHVQSLHEAHGVKFHLGTTPKSIRDKTVELSDGSSLDADLVVLGVGVKPRISLAETAGLTVDRGVVVDEELRTSAPDIWAAGDVAKYTDKYSGETVRIEHWVVAERQGQCAARSMLGRGRPYRDVPFFWSAHYDVVIAYVGHAPRYDMVEVRGDLARNEATVVYRLDRKVLAVATLNRDKVSLAVEAAMERGDSAAIETALGVGWQPPISL